MSCIVTLACRLLSKRPRAQSEPQVLITLKLHMKRDELVATSTEVTYLSAWL